MRRLLLVLSLTAALAAPPPADAATPSRSPSLPVGGYPSLDATGRIPTFPPASAEASGAMRPSTAARRSAAVRAPMSFSMVGFRAPRGASVEFRSSDDGATWSAWTETQPLGDEQPDAPRAEGTGGATHGVTQATAPLWVGRGRWLQIDVTGAVPARVSAVLVDTLGLSASPAQRAAAASTSTAASAADAVDRPKLVTRAGWGADEGLRRDRADVEPDVRFAVVHHTAGTNDYSQAEAPAIVRGIYRYHVLSLGWDDIGYNLLVDRFGTLYEGRAGGTTRGVIGAHAKGFNTGSFGISVLANFEQARPTRATMTTLAHAIAWKFARHAVDATRRVRVESLGSNKVAAGVNVRLRSLTQHRSLSYTACPGLLGSRLARLRERVDGLAGDYAWARGLPLAGDWNGDGDATPGWFRNGVLSFARRNRTSLPSRTRRWGERGDLPLAGDWDGDGRDSPGVRRGNRWYLAGDRRSDPVTSVGFGRRRDRALVGDWDGDGADGIGVRRGRTWYLVDRPGGRVTRRVRWGLPTDRPLVGDWDGDGRDGLGLVRDGRMYLSDDPGRAPALRSDFGRSGGRRVVGDWDGDGRDTVGVVRRDRWYLTDTVTAARARTRFVFEG